jgi:hypothetical protein
LSEEAVGKTKSKQQPKTHWFCGKCGNDFWGAKKTPKCPKCNEEFDLTELNEDGIPIEDMRRIMESRSPAQILNPGGVNEPSLNERPKLTLDLSREALSRADEMGASMFEREVDESIRDHISSNIKAKALKSKRELIEEEKKIRALEVGEEVESVPGGGYPGQPLAQPNPMGASMLVQSIAGLDEESQTRFFDMIKDPQVAYGLASILNPPKQTLQGYNPYNNPAAQIQSVLGGMQMTQPHQERAEESPAEGMKDMAQTIKIMFETMRDMTPQREEGLNSDLKEVLTEIKRGQEELRDKYYSLQLAQLEGKGGAGGEGLSKEDLDEIIEKRLQSLNKSPKDALNEIKATILAVDELRDTMSGEAPEQQEPLDTWVKKHTMQREAEDQKASHEMKIKELEAKAAKWGTAKTLLQDGIRANLLKMGESKKEEVVPELEPEMRRKKVQLVK